jgi:hypothetical protein
MWYEHDDGDLALALSACFTFAVWYSGSVL